MYAWFFKWFNYSNKEGKEEKMATNPKWKANLGEYANDTQWLNEKVFV